MPEKKTPAVQEAPVQAVDPVQAIEPVDEWSITKHITLPRPRKGESPDYFVSIGPDRHFRVKRGYSVPVPLPVYERLMIIMEAEMAEDKLYAEENGKMMRIGGPDLNIPL